MHLLGVTRNEDTKKNPQQIEAPTWLDLKGEGRGSS